MLILRLLPEFFAAVWLFQAFLVFRFLGKPAFVLPGKLTGKLLLRNRSRLFFLLWNQFHRPDRLRPFPGNLADNPGDLLCAELKILRLTGIFLFILDLFKRLGELLLFRRPGLSPHGLFRLFRLTDFIRTA